MMAVSNIKGQWNGFGDWCESAKLRNVPFFEVRTFCENHKCNKFGIARANKGLTLIEQPICI